MTPSLEAVVPLGAILIPLGSNEKDGKGVRLVANTGEDVAVDPVNEGPELPPVDPGAGRGFVPFVDVAGNPDGGTVVEGFPVSTKIELELMEFRNEFMIADCLPEFVPEVAITSESVELVFLASISELSVLGTDVPRSEAVPGPRTLGLGEDPLETPDAVEPAAPVLALEDRSLFDTNTLSPCHV